MNHHTHIHTHTRRMQRVEETKKDTFFLNSPLKHDLSLSGFFFICNKYFRVAVVFLVFI